MNPLIAWPPLSPEIVAALQRMETAQDFAGLRGDYDLVQSEAHRRSLPAMLAMMPGMALFALIYGGAQLLDWIRWPEFFANLGWIVIVPFTAVFTNFLRGEQAVKDEMRIGAALQKWRKQAEKTT